MVFSSSPGGGGGGGPFDYMFFCVAAAAGPSSLSALGSADVISGSGILFSGVLFFPALHLQTLTFASCLLNSRHLLKRREKTFFKMSVVQPVPVIKNNFAKSPFIPVPGLGDMMRKVEQ